MTKSHTRILWIAIATGILLLIPLVAMQFTTEVNWTLFDFIFAGTLLFGSGLAYELISRRSPNVLYRLAVGGAALTTLLLIWINGAVGIIGDSGMNLLYGAVVAVLCVGAIFARLRPQGMSIALYITAFVQFSIPVVALVAGTDDFSPGVIPVFVLNGFFVTAFLVSGILFRQAGSTSARLA